MQTENRDRYLDVDRRLSELSGAGAAAGATLPSTLGGVPGDTTGGVTLPPTTATGAVSRQQAPFSDPQGANAAAGAPSALGGPPVSTFPQAGTPQVTQPATGGPAVAGAITQAPAPQGINANLGEQELYRTALNILLEEQPERYEESISMFQSYIQRFPQGRLLTNAYYWLGAALILVERYDEAVQALSTLISNYPDDAKAPSALLTRGEVYQRMGQNDLAEQDWRSIATRYPENVTEIREAEDRLRRL